MIALLSLLFTFIIIAIVDLAIVATTLFVIFVVDIIGFTIVGFNSRNEIVRIALNLSIIGLAAGFLGLFPSLMFAEPLGYLLPAIAVSIYAIAVFLLFAAPSKRAIITGGAVGAGLLPWLLRMSPIYAATPLGYLPTIYALPFLLLVGTLIGMVFGHIFSRVLNARKLNHES